MKSDTVFKLFEAGLLIGIILLLSITLLLAFVDVTYVIYVQISTPPLLIIDARGLMELFSLILMLLIGLELIETVKTYFKEEAVHVELIVLVAIIAIARKVVVWDFEKHTPTELYSLAAVVLALGVTYFLVKLGALKVPPWPRRMRRDEDG